jgi:hypothetical protein
MPRNLRHFSPAPLLRIPGVVSLAEFGRPLHGSVRDGIGFLAFEKVRGRLD